MISIAGGEDVAGPPGLKSPEVQWGARRAQPDVVIAMPCGWYVERGPRQALEHWDGSRRLARTGSTRSTRPRPSRARPALVDGVELLGHLLHPDLVGSPGNIGFAEVRAAL
jgi:iron complex transport system substrate-binding protein